MDHEEFFMLLTGSGKNVHSDSSPRASGCVTSSPVGG